MLKPSVSELKRLAAAYGSTVPELRRAIQCALDSFTSDTRRDKELNEILSKQGFDNDETDETASEAKQMVLRNNLVGNGTRHPS